MALTRITKGVIKPNENYDTHNINSTGIVTAVGANFTGDVNVGGVLTYEDVTSIDSVGIITARNGIDCNGDIDVDGHTNLDNVSIAGITTGGGFKTAGTSSDAGATNGFTAGRINIYDNNSHNIFRIGTSPSFAPTVWQTSAITFTASSFSVTNTQSTREYININNSTGILKLGYGGVGSTHGFKFETSAKGIKVGTGVTIETNGQATFVGVVTFGSGSTTIDDNVVNVGTALTLGHTQGLQFHTQNLHAQGFEVNQINASGIVTASSFSGSVAASNLTGTIPTARLGSGTANSSTFLRGDSTFAVVDTALVADTSPQLGGNLDVNTKNIVFGDSGSSSDDRLIFGAGSDLQIYHNANNNKTYIGNKTSTDLLIENAGTNTDIVDDTGHYRARFIKDGAVQLYYDNVRKLRTTSGGITFEATDAGGSEHFGRFYWKQESGTVRGLFDAASQKFQIYDNSQFSVGNSHDSVWFHDGSNTYLVNNTGNLLSRNDGSSTSEEILIQPKGGENSIRAIANGSVELYHDNVVKARTNSGSWQVHGDVISEPNVGNQDAGFRGYPEGSAVYTWFRGYSSDGAHNAGMITHSGQTLFLDSSNNQHIYYRANGTGIHYFQTNSTNRMTINANNIFLPDSQVINFGAGNDLQLYHDSSNSYITNTTGQLAIENSSGNLSIKASNSTGDIIMRAGGGTSSENAIVAVHHGEVVLSFNGSSRLTTTNTGVTLDGTGALKFPVGTTAQRPSASQGMVRYNSTTNQLEVYDGSEWANVNSQPFEATGGSTSTSSRSGYKVHTFTSPGTFTVSGDVTNKTIEVLVIGGGGAGGEGGGGAGALRFTNNFTASPGNYSVSIGGGGSGNQSYGNNGSSSSFGNITAPGGGGGGGSSRGNGNPGGSGGGTRRDNGGSPGNGASSGGSNNSNSPSSGWGNRGGSGNIGNWCGGGGGGGAGGVGGQGNGGSPNGERGGPGGSGLAYSINGSSVERAGGGGGGTEGAGNPSGPGRGGNTSGGGGRGGVSNQVPGGFGASAGTANTGGGGGGNASTGYSGGNHSGGSGIVIVAYTT